MLYLGFLFVDNKEIFLRVFSDEMSAIKALISGLVMYGGITGSRPFCEETDTSETLATKMTEWNSLVKISRRDLKFDVRPIKLVPSN